MKKKAAISKIAAMMLAGIMFMMPVTQVYAESDEVPETTITEEAVFEEEIRTEELTDDSGEEIAQEEQRTDSEDEIAPEEQTTDSEDEIAPEELTNDSGEEFVSEEPTAPEEEAILEEEANPASIKASAIINYFNSQIGINKLSGWCLKFCDDGYQSLGFDIARYASAYKMACAYSLNKSKTPPVGAYCFFYNASISTNGHVGVWVGDGVVATQGTSKNAQPIAKKSIDAWAAYSGSFLGWCIPNGLTVVNDMATGVSGLEALTWHQKGSFHTVYGTITGAGTITEVTLGVYDMAGNMKTGTTVYPNSATYNIHDADAQVKFASLSEGAYVYRIYATVGGTRSLLSERYFPVVTAERTIDDGIYMMQLAKNKFFAAGIAGNSSADMASVQLVSYSASDNFQQFRFEYQDNGYYKITNIGSGLCLDAYNAGTANGTDVIQHPANGTAAQRWQVLPDGAGDYVLVPECAKTIVLDVNGGTEAAGTNIQLWQMNRDCGAQRWHLVTARTRVTSVSINKKTASVQVGKTITLKAEVMPSDASNKFVSWESSDTNVAKVSLFGVVTGKAPGKAVITVRTSDGAKTASCTVCVGFTDVQNSSAYYYDPVYWGTQKGVVAGFSDNTFRPNETVTRGQVVMFLWRLAGKPEPKTAKNPFADLKSTHAYYKAILWANEKGIALGFSDKTFRVNDTCTRGQIVTFLWRYKGKPKAGQSAKTFSDVKKGHVYYDAVRWAAFAGVTNGNTNGTFGPDARCTRGQCITFIYRIR